MLRAVAPAALILLLAACGPDEGLEPFAESRVPPARSARFLPPEGFVKTVFDAKTGELLGAHMIGAEVTELIQGYSVAKTLETTEAELMATVFPHPTLSEMMHESVLAAYGRTLHI
jgi:pyruvate/2-oxoglutarate dehydrogenase complex dihydrolipoamide dehydrogenase (E3) component